MHPGLTHSSPHFSGVIFQFVGVSNSLGKNKRSKKKVLAIGGRYYTSVFKLLFHPFASYFPSFSVKVRQVVMELSASRTSGSPSECVCSRGHCDE